MLHLPGGLRRRSPREISMLFRSAFAPRAVPVAVSDRLKATGMAGQTIKLSRPLWVKVKKCAEAAGYSSPDEFVEHVLEKELASLEETQSDEEIARKLKGLGYLD